MVTAIVIINMIVLTILHYVHSLINKHKLVGYKMQDKCSNREILKIIILRVSCLIVWERHAMYTNAN
jgi:accessory gene regulator protein AgrB